jgi:type IV pilus assembly protein PilV
MVEMESMRTANQGFSLIEVLIAMLILAVGILGAGALQTVGLQVTQGASYRSQAVILSSEMIDRMYANRTALASYAGTDTSTVVVAAAPSCWTDAAGCTPAQIAAADISGWTARVSALPAGAGTIVQQANGDYVVTVTWNENEWTGAAAARAQAAQSFQLVVSL